MYVCVCVCVCVYLTLNSTPVESFLGESVAYFSVNS